MIKNNRVLKFRAWSLKEKKMYGVFDLNLEDSIMKQTGLPLHIAPQSYFLWLQFTGLKDRNEREIYEGDIVKSPTGQTAPVEWSPAGFWGLNNYIKHPKPGSLTKVSLRRQSKFWRFLNPGSWEVIGNIYENPELLKKD